MNNKIGFCKCSMPLHIPGRIDGAGFFDCSDLAHAAIKGNPRLPQAIAAVRCRATSDETSKGLNVRYGEGLNVRYGAGIPPLHFREVFRPKRPIHRQPPDL
jgi:hypothetical protein